MSEMSTANPAYIFLENALMANKQKIQSIENNIRNHQNQIKNLQTAIDSSESERRILMHHLDDLYLGLKILGDAIPVNE